MNNDFAFETGTWTVTHRQLRGEEWVEFTSTASAHGFFEGNGSFEEHVFHELGTRGTAFRLYDPAVQEWAIYWASSRDGKLQTPARGRFVDGVGTFVDEDGTGRFHWKDITPTSAHWYQEHSEDGGTTWVTNWTMDFTRVSASSSPRDDAVVVEE
ncbi:hypothetical protein AB0E69_26770 [Kribbella sp. NPDC026611]|uniref:hypothetical protein n=1 Tax=Kribbella sp. NPDC026611 TaxID=3154911 RepID=UPI00340E2DC7